MTSLTKTSLMPKSLQTVTCKHLKGQANIANTVNFSNSPDNQMQGLQKFQAASVLIKVSSEVSRMMQVVEQTLSPLWNHLQNLCLWQGKNQSFNKLRRHLIKPSLPTKLVKLADHDGNSVKIHIWRWYLRILFWKK